MLPALLTTTERTRLMRALVAVLVLDPLRLPAPRAHIGPAVETSLEVRPLRLPTLRAGSIAHRSNHSITKTHPAEIPCAAQATRLQSTTTPAGSDTDAGRRLWVPGFMGSGTGAPASRGWRSAVPRLFRSTPAATRCRRGERAAVLRPLRASPATWQRQPRAGRVRFEAGPVCCRRVLACRENSGRRAGRRPLTAAAAPASRPCPVSWRLPRLAVGGVVIPRQGRSWHL